MPPMPVMSPMPKSSPPDSMFKSSALNESPGIASSMPPMPVMSPMPKSSPPDSAESSEESAISGKSRSSKLKESPAKLSRDKSSSREGISEFSTFLLSSAGNSTSSILIPSPKGFSSEDKSTGSEASSLFSDKSTFPSPRLISSRLNPSNGGNSNFSE